MDAKEYMKELSNSMVEANQMLADDISFIRSAKAGTDCMELDVLADYLAAASDSILELAKATSLTVIKPDSQKIATLAHNCNCCISNYMKVKESWRRRLN